MTFEKAMKSLEYKFSSGNDIPVEMAIIKRKEWKAIKKKLKEKKHILPYENCRPPRQLC